MAGRLGGVTDRGDQGVRVGCEPVGVQSARSTLLVGPHPGQAVRLLLDLPGDGLRAAAVAVPWLFHLGWEACPNSWASTAARA